MRHLLCESVESLGEWLKQQGQPTYRAKQIFHWLLVRRAGGFDEMSDLPKALRAALAQEFVIWSANVARHSKAEDGSEKLLLELADRGRIECVLLRDQERRTICISTQVGCAMGCVFCASGLDGVDRNLTRGEILEEMLLLQRLLPADERLSHIVVMGMGEPLANLDQLLPALGEATRHDGLGISHRRITISTVGLPKGMAKLREHPIKYNLAVSLHAPNDGLRTRIVPVNKNIGIDAVLAEADLYFEASGRRLTYEYALLSGLNDSPQCARELVQLLAPRNALLNVIPYNPVAGLPYETPSDAAMAEFRTILERGGVTVKFRKRKGDSINAACGQLRRSTPNDLVTLSS
jgi:23S rRNA (adenine2503-C2)-methyltransferase